MKRTLAHAMLAVFLIASLAGCGGAADDGDAGTEATASAPSAGQPDAPQGLEPMPTDGAGESAALAAVPAALEAGKTMREGSGMAWPDLSGLEPSFVAYLVSAEYDGQVALFEVRSEGTPHNLYAYPRAFDSGSIVWTAAENSQGPKAEPRSDRETAAVEAVRAAMTDAFPGETLSFAVQGYRFVFVRDGAVVLSLEVDPQGGVISVGS